MTAGPGDHVARRFITDRASATGCPCSSSPRSPRCAPSPLADQEPAGLVHLPRRHRPGLPHHRPGRVRRAEPAADPGAVRQADGRSADVWRDVDPHPIKVNMAGVIPVIFASRCSRADDDHPVQQPTRRSRSGSPGSTTTRPDGDHPIYVHFTTISSCSSRSSTPSITFNPGRGRRQHEAVWRLHPGIRAGDPRPSTSSTCSPGSPLPGAIYLTLISSSCSSPSSSSNGQPTTSSSGGTSHPDHRRCRPDTVKQIEAQLQQRHYEGFPPMMRVAHLRPPVRGRARRPRVMAARYGIPI